jgi:hypothetical protein
MPKTSVLAAPVIAVVVLACSATGAPERQVVGTEGSGGRAGSGAGGVGGGLGGVGGGSSPFNVHIEQNQIRIEIVTLSCSGECADVVAVARNGRPPYSFTWENGSTDPARRVCPASDTRYRVTVTDTGTGGEVPRPPVTVEATLTADVLECPDAGGRDAGGPSECERSTQPFQVIAAVPARATPFTGALPDYVGSTGAPVYLVAQGRVTLAAPCTRLLLAGDPSGTVAVGWDDHLVIEYREAPAGPASKRWKYGAFGSSYRGQPLPEPLAPSVPGSSLVPPILNPLPYGYPPLAIDLMTEVSGAASTFELTLLVLDQGNVGSTTDIWVIPR